MNNLLDVLNKSVIYLEKKKIRNARLTVEKVLSGILGMDRIMLYASFERILTEEELSKIRKKLNSTVTGEIGKSAPISGNDEKKRENLQDITDSLDTLKVLIDKSILYLEKNNIKEAGLITEIIFSHVL